MLAITGYSDRLSVRQGQSIEFKVSSLNEQPYEARLVRVLFADPNPDGPGLQEEDLSCYFSGRFLSRKQDIHLGSCAKVENISKLSLLEDFTYVATILIIRPGPANQGIMGCYDMARGTGVSLELDNRGRLCARLSTTGQIYFLEAPLSPNRWYRVWLSIGTKNNIAILGQHALCPISNELVNYSNSFKNLLINTLPRDNSFYIGSAYRKDKPCNHFNGKIERPRIFGSALNAKQIEDLDYENEQVAAVADWDFSQDISSMTIRDKGPLALDGYLINAPTRAVKGSNWTGEEMCWRHALEQYGAIHFHEDDLYDCQWKTDFTLTVPNNLPSGVYGMRLSCVEDCDIIPFYVLPAQTNPRNKIAVLIPTLTYTIYGNHARDKTDKNYIKRANCWRARCDTPDNNPQFRLSGYNTHSDGSGISYVSRLRPMLNFRPNYLTFSDTGVGSGVHHFGADFYLLSWLDNQRQAYDIVTDEELDNEGESVLKPYTVVLTTSHPEYHTKNSLDSVATFTGSGGRLMYLGGNGFYWRVATNPSIPGLVEIRRNETGIRTWASEPGDYYHSLDGTYGGLWRRNGRPPQQLTGVGFTAQGKFRGSFYRRTKASYAPDVAWIFEGIETEIIGNFGLAGGGGAGFELDRSDIFLGTSPNACVLASSEEHDESFQLVYEDILWNEQTTTGEPEADMIRADMTYIELPKGGMMFSVGSITFTGALPINNYQNNISRLTANILNRALDLS